MTQNKIALVTGAASGLGLAIARDLAAQGNAIIAVDRSDAVQEVARELSSSERVARGFVADLELADDIHSLTDSVLKEFGAVDILVNCAGIHPQGPNGEKQFLDEVTDEVWLRTLTVNLTAPFRLMKAFIPGMKERGWGRVVNIASRAGQTFVPATTVDYSSSKAGIIGLTRMSAGELAPFGVTVNAVAPGRITTPLAMSQAPELIAAGLKTIPMQRLGEPDEIAATVTFLASEGASYITGLTIGVNGGAFIS
jgi:3-oxoacyl-[acyl-carrier protein] reductase